MSQIKLIVLLVLYSIYGNSQNDEVLFYIEEDPVMVSEFQYIYEKNNRDNADYSKESLDEYLDLYINFKLKVHKARLLGYSDSEAYQEELAGYRSQLADSYIINREVISRMVDEIYMRHQIDVELKHILISCPAKTSKQKEKEALDKINIVKIQIDKGMSFEQAVVQFSQDRSSAALGGDIGFINAPLPEGFTYLEDIAYSLQPGQISDPIRTDLGYHIIQVISKRPARGTMEAQHLLIRKERNGIRLADALPKVKRIYNSIIDGSTTFEDATVMHSEDKDTKGTFGNLGFFTIGQYERSFEDAAFGISEDGGISSPVETSIGWHIIRRVSKRGPDNKKAIEERLKNQPNQGARFERIKDDVVAQIQKEANFNENRALLKEFGIGLADDFFNYNWQISEYDKDVLLSFGEDSYDLNDFVQFAKKESKIRMRAKGQKTIEETVAEIYESFVDAKAISFAEDRLEDRYPEFKNLMREYREGILLFDITKDYVWDKAANDTFAIRVYYNDHREDYQWEDRAVITHYSIRSVTPSVVAPILNAATNAGPKSIVESFNKENELVLYRQETLERSHNTLKGMTLAKGTLTSPEFNQGLKVSTFKKIEEIIPARPKTLKEAKGYIISDYQDQLDKEWIETLKKEYKVKIQKKTLKKLVK